MFNATRRNRNIGTRKAGFKKQSVFKIPDTLLSDNYSKAEKHTVGDITFFIDKLKEGYIFSCSIEDVVGVLNKLPKEDLRGINYIYFYQPSHKRNILSPAWGKIYYHGGPDYFPIITLDAQPCPFKIKMDLHLDPFWQIELDFLKENCETYKLTKRHHILTFQKEHLRAIQLFRTLPHEIGHWVDYKKDIDTTEERANRYAKKFNLRD